MLRLLLATLPLAAGLFLLRRMPAAADTPLDQVVQGLWRLDPPALAGLVLLPIAALRPQRSVLDALRVTLGMAGAMLALATTLPVLQVVLLYVVSIVLFGRLGPRWYIALAAVSVSLLGPQLAVQADRYVDLAATLVFPSLLLAALVGSGGWSLSGRGGSNEWELVLRPLWPLLLLRSLENEPWPVLWASIALVVVALAMVVATVAAFTTHDPRRTRERMLALVLLMVLLSIALNTTTGLVAALWCMLVHGLLMVWTGPNAGTRSPIAMLTLIAVAVWWAAGAAASAGVFLLAGAIWFAGTGTGIATLLPLRPRHPSGGDPAPIRPSEPSEAAGTLARRTRWGVHLADLALVLALLLGMPFVTNVVAVPVADRLGAGLTAFGLLDIWQWIGVAALNSGHRRIEALPSVALVVMFLVVFAVVWLLGRSSGRLVTPDDTAVDTDKAVRLLRSRIWWLGPQRDG